MVPDLRSPQCQDEHAGNRLQNRDFATPFQEECLSAVPGWWGGVTCSMLNHLRSLPRCRVAPALRAEANESCGWPVSYALQDLARSSWTWNRFSAPHSASGTSEQVSANEPRHQTHTPNRLRNKGHIPSFVHAIACPCVGGFQALTGEKKQN